jgi:hypothetical protein
MHSELDILERTRDYEGIDNKTPDVSYLEESGK